MGDETSQFANRFAAATKLLAEIAQAHPAPGRRRGAGAAAGLSEALDAVEAVYESGTGALRNWAEQRSRVLAQVAALRRAVAAGGAGDELRGLARDLLHLIEARPAGR